MLFLHSPLSALSLFSSLIAIVAVVVFGAPLEPFDRLAAFSVLHAVTMVGPLWLYTNDVLHEEHIDRLQVL